MSRARNRGLLEARGEFIAFLDDDDAVLPDHLSVLHEALAEHPSAGAAFGQLLLCDHRFENPAPAYLTPPFPSGECLEYTIRQVISQDTVMFRTSALVSVGGYDTDLTQLEDWDLTMRFAARWDMVGVWCPVAMVRMYTGPRLTSVSTFGSWRKYRLPRRLVERRAMSIQGRVCIPRLNRWRSVFALRGQATFHTFEFAVAAADRGLHRDARLLVFGAMTVSPVHAVNLLWSFAPTIVSSFIPAPLRK